MLDLSILIVHYKTPQVLLNCLKSVYEYTQNINFEIIVIDNHSQDDTQNLLKTHFPNVVWLQMGYNSGFSRANNAGIKHSKGKFVLLLNSDTVLLDNNLLQQCLDRMNQKPQAAAGGVQLLYQDLSLQVSKGMFSEPYYVFMMMPYFGKLYAWFVAWCIKKYDRKHKNNIDYLVGAFLLVNQKFIAKAGLMDEDFFLYCEEIEWCKRLHGQGEILFFDDLSLIHIGNATGSITFNKKQNFGRQALQQCFSSQIYVRKHAGVGAYVLLMMLFVASIPCFFVGLKIHQLLSRKPIRYNQTDFETYAKAVFGWVALMPKVIFKKPVF